MICVLLIALLIAIFNAGCSPPPRPTICYIINNKVAQCIPTDGRTKEFDKDVRRMRGYACVSPTDVGGIQVWTKRIIREIEQLSFINPIP